MEAGRGLPLPVGWVEAFPFRARGPPLFPEQLFKLPETEGTGSPPGGGGEAPRADTITFDDRLWPLVIVRYVGTVTAGQYEACLEGQRVRLERGPCLFLFDTSRADSRLADYRRRQVAWLTRNEALLHEAMSGAAFIITSPIIRLAASILHHVRPMPFPQIFVSQEAQALPWLAQRLRESGALAQAEALERLAPR
jgi:hypothetical protein